MKKTVSQSQLLYFIIPLFTIGVLALRFVYIQRQGNFNAQYYNPMINISKDKNIAEFVMFDKDNNLSIVTKETDTKSSIIISENINKVHSLSSIKIQNTYFPDATGINATDYGPPVNKIAFSEDENLLIGANGVQVGVYDMLAKKWFFKKIVQEGGMEYHPLGFLNTKTAMVLLTPMSPSITQRPYICFLDTQTGKIKNKKEIPLPKNTFIDGVKWINSQKQILITTSTMTYTQLDKVYQYSISSPYQIFAFDGLSLKQVKARTILQPSKQIIVSLDGKRALISLLGGPSLGYIWNISKDTLEEIPGKKREFQFGENILAFSPNGKRVAAGGDKGIYVWNTDTKKWEVNFEDLSSGPFNFFISTYSNNGLMHSIRRFDHLYKIETISASEK
jgi:WD40 repeat protein